LQKQKMKPYAPVTAAKSGSMLLIMSSLGLKARYMTDYDAGMENGKRQEREAILEYIEHHPNGTLEDIADEIESRYKFDHKMKMAGIKWS
jgi:hypothetical protein